MQSIGQVSCSLNLGLIYSVDYSYSPQDGVNVVIFFVKEDGIYNKPNLLPLQKAFIRIGPASFSLYPIRYKLSTSQGQRIMEVEFVDDLFRLSHYYLALTGRGCGQNVYNLGTPVDDRTLSEKMAAALDPIAERIKDFTQFPDYQYSFSDFLAVLRTKINVSVRASFDGTITRDFVGTFRAVLEEWLSLYNLSYFFENGELKIFDPTVLNITLPSAPTNALSYEEELDVRSTYGKTVFNWYQQEGKGIQLNQTTDTNGPLYVRTDTLYPMGYEFGLSQTSMDLNQVAAAQYGKEFWFLYNFANGGTASNCGFTPISQNTSVSVVLSVRQAANGDGEIAIYNDETFNQNFEAFYQYGQTLAGRWYLSNQKSELATDQNFTWFDESNGQIFSFSGVDDRAINLEFLTPTSNGVNKVPNTAINDRFPGFNYIGNRIAYYDNVAPNITGTFALDGATQGLINSTYQSIFTLPGNESFDFNTDLAPLYTGANTFVAYNNGVSMPSSITSLINEIPSKASVFNPRFDSIPIKGIPQGDYSSLKASQSEPDDVDVVNTNEGGQVIANTSVIKTLKGGNYTIYYDKYSTCGSASSPDNYFGYEFAPNQVSPDEQVDVTFQKLANNSYKLTRNFDVINAQVNNPFLSRMAQARTFGTRRVTFSLNYFYDVPVNFLTNGLVGMSVSVNGGGIRSSYTFSNEVLEVAGQAKARRAAQEAADYAQRIRNSTLRKYQPTEVIS